MANPGRVQGQSPGSGGQEAKPTEAESFWRLDVKIKCLTFASFVVFAILQTPYTRSICCFLS